MSRRYALEVRRTVWILWGYGPRGANYGVEHMEPACAYLNVGFDTPLEMPFELPEHEGDGAAPVEYERREGLAWRFTDHAGGGTGWSLAASEEEALAAAKAKVDRMPFHNRVYFADAPVERT